MPPLIGADLRVQRARRLIGTLKRQSRRWAERHAEFIGAEQDKSTGNINLFLMPDDAEPLGRDVNLETGTGSLRFKYDAEVELLLADGRPIQETLQALCSEVAATVELFKSRIDSR